MRMGGGPGVQFHFGGPGGGMGGMHGGMPDIMAQMMGGMGGMGDMGGMGGMHGMHGGGMPRQRRQRRRVERPHVLPERTQVLVRGLQGAAQHNGKEGVVTGYDEAASRYEVNVGDGDTSLRIKGENLLQLPTCKVINMQSRPELNGTSARVTGFDETLNRYHVSLNGQMAALQPQNLVLPSATRARVIGLKSQPHWNGQVGKVLSFDSEKCRYLIQMTEQQQLSVKLENLIL